MKKTFALAAVFGVVLSGYAIAQTGGGDGGANTTGPTGPSGTSMGGSYGGSTRNSASPTGGMPTANGAGPAAAPNPGQTTTNPTSTPR